MLCRIHITQEPERRTIHVAGRLAGTHVDDLLGLCGQGNGRVRIDLTDMFSIDRAGLHALRLLAGTGIEIVGLAQYLRYELEALQ